MSKIQTTEAGFDRDTSSMALLNNKRAQYEEYKKRRDDQIEADQEIADLKSEITDIKNMLKSLMEQ